MAERRGGQGASWFVIGFLAGVAATLAVMIYTAGRPARQAEAAEPSTVVTYTPPRIVRPRRAALSESASPALAGSPAAPDEQVQEDAAATGMTSRARAEGQDPR